MFVFMLFTAVASEVDPAFVVAEVVFYLSAFWSLRILSDRPLLNPVQTVALLFFWWFGVAPTVIGAFNLLAGNLAQALRAQQDGLEALWIVAIGLPLYSIAAKRTLDWLQSRRLYARFLMPAGKVYRPKTLLLYWIAGMLAQSLVRILPAFGVQGIQAINFLGGTRTDIWWVGVINAFGRMAEFATVGIVYTLATSFRKSPWWLIVLGSVITVQSMITAVTSGSKTAFVYLFFYFVCARIAVTQRLPWRMLLVVILGFLIIVEPFVTSTRVQAQQAGAQTPEARIQVFSQAIQEGALLAGRDWRDIQVAQLFRGIYPLAGEITRQNSWFNGYWQGETIARGLQVIVPRALLPGKPDADIGNFFARTVGVDIGISTPDNYDYNISLSIPFEVVGNYGSVAGVGSFALIGLFWALLCGWLLSPERLSSHPLSPYFVSVALIVESPLGNVLAIVRDLFFPIIGLYFAWLLLRKRL